MKNWNAKIWLAALALQLPPHLIAANTVAADAVAADTPAGAAARSRAAMAEVPAAHSDEAPPAVGTLTVQWTITGRREPLDCTSLGVERLVLSLRSSGAGEDQSEGSCDAFQMSIDLSPGSYTGDAMLVDRLDRPVTLSVPVEQLEIVAGRDLVQSIDFPVSAFL